MNVLIKNLTIVNVVFLPLGVIAGMGGMWSLSRFLDEQRSTSTWATSCSRVAMVVFGFGLWWLVKTIIDRLMGRGNGTTGRDRPAPRPNGKRRSSSSRSYSGPRHSQAPASRGRKERLGEHPALTRRRPQPSPARR